MSSPMDSFYSAKINKTQKEYDDERKSKLSDIESTYKNQYEKISNAKNDEDNSLSNTEKMFTQKTNVLKNSAFVQGKILKKRINMVDSLQGVNNSGLTKRSKDNTDFGTGKKVYEYDNQLKSDMQTVEEKRKSVGKDAFDKLSNLSADTERKKQKVEDDYNLKLQKLYNQIDLTKRQYNAKELEKKLKTK